MCKFLSQYLLLDCHQFLINLIIGIVTTILLLWPLHNIRPLVALENLAIDMVINLRAHTSLKDPKTPHFVLLNLDEKTHQQWGEPLITPRDKLQQLIEFAISGRPRVIVVDIDLTYPSHCVTERTQCSRADTQLNKVDTELKNFLEHYAKSNDNSQFYPDLILIKTSQVVLDVHDKPTEQRQKRYSFLDSVVNNKDNQHIHWASTLFELEENRLRRWRLCEPNKLNQLNSLPSVQLLIKELLDPESELSCAKTEDEDLSQRILYAVRPTSERFAYPLVQSSDGVQRPLLTSYPAYQLVADNPDVDKESVKQTLQHSITVIGSSYAESNDLYATPIGTMPGALIVINAIHSLQQHGLFHKPHWSMAFLIEIISIIVMSYLFTRLKFYGKLISGLTVIIIMIPASFLCFEYGTWLDFVIPLIAVQVHGLSHHREV